MSKGNAQVSNGDVCNHLSPFIPRKTPRPSDTSNWVPMPAYRMSSRLLLFDGGRGFIVDHLHNVGTHMTLPVESSGRFHLQFTCIQVAGYNALTS